MRKLYYQTLSLAMQNYAHEIIFEEQQQKQVFAFKYYCICDIDNVSACCTLNPSSV
jgi:hypothetical protein